MIILPWIRLLINLITVHGKYESRGQSTLFYYLCFREVILEGLHELLYIAPCIDLTLNEREMSMVQRKILECFRSPRSTVVRVACQVSGELFRIVKCTRRPEFTELTDVLLTKSADSNRFIKRDANVALDKLFSYLPIFHVVRAICTNGPL